MDEIGLLEGINITITSIVMVFLVLFGMLLILVAFKYIFKDEPVAAKKVEHSPQPTLPLEFEEDTENKTAAVLMALILANDNKQNKYYQVNSVKRVK